MDTSAAMLTSMMLFSLPIQAFGSKPSQSRWEEMTAAQIAEQDDYTLWITNCDYAPRHFCKACMDAEFLDNFVSFRRYFS
jgi:hypothetical protein